ncbi:unnamed protein product [Adineta ricciae]|uniref:Uncharacterized protein n=1 Tax=Adineta ricciae TaxID=249248 RepID=A0A816FGK1_ADIRI|nr:unnamed protein product [Adineta ricciae]CAF1661324.1 unnamed protein product [Adineta ricciae]
MFGPLEHFWFKLFKITLLLKDLYSKTRLRKTLLVVQILIVSLLFLLDAFFFHGIFHSLTLNPVRKYRIAHCITGAPRTLYREEVYVAYQRQALNKLPGDLFIVLQMTSKTEMVHGTLIKSSPPRSYANALKYLSPRKIEWISVNNHLGAVKDTSGYAKWKRCLDHIEEAEKIDGLKYDFIVRSRPDLYIAKDLPSADILPKDRVLINPYYECLQHIPSGYNQRWTDIQPPCDKKNYGLSDLFAILPRGLAAPYMRVAYTSNLPKHICGSSAIYQECLIRAVLYKQNITFELWPFVVKIMRSADFCRHNSWNRFNSWC